MKSSKNHQILKKIHTVFCTVFYIIFSTCAVFVTLMESKLRSISFHTLKCVWNSTAYKRRCVTAYRVFYTICKIECIAPYMKILFNILKTLPIITIISVETALSYDNYFIFY